MTARARRYGLLAGLAIGFGLVAVGTGGQEGGPPDVDRRGMEPQVGELLARLSEGIRSGPEGAAAWLEYGETLHAHGLVREAAECYRAALALLPAGDVVRLSSRSSTRKRAFGGTRSCG